jgi:hypothetical protein
MHTVLLAIVTKSSEEKCEKVRVVSEKGRV